MNILFFISSSEKGAGGHYNSLNQICLELSKRHKVGIVLLGNGVCPIIVSNRYFISQITYPNLLSSLTSVRKQIKAINEKFNADIFHCFDAFSFNQLVITNIFGRSTPIVLNKCGGMNPLGRKYLQADAIIVFSKENEDWFRNNPSYEESKIFLIPNRVMRLEKIPDHQRIEAAHPEKITFVRITRIGGAYENTLINTLHLLDTISQKVPVELYIIGTINSHGFYNKLLEITKNKNFEVKFITDSRAYQASSFLYLADYVIGTGRSFMEAISLGIPTLAPAKNADVPILVTRQNIQTFFNHNFSERTICDESDIQYSEQSIIRNFSNPMAFKELSTEVKDIFNQNFGTEAICSRYENVYSMVEKNIMNNLHRIVINFKYLLKFLIFDKK